MHTTAGKPETVEAWLASAAKPHLPAPACFTRHVYDHSEVVHAIDIHGIRVSMLVHMFRCTETGMLRRWGSESVPFAMRGN